VSGGYDPSQGANLRSTGLGLFIVKSLVGLMGGSVGVSSTAGTGTRFWFSFSCDNVNDVDRPGRRLIHDMECNSGHLYRIDSARKCHKVDTVSAGRTPNTEARELAAAQLAASSSTLLDLTQRHSILIVDDERECPLLSLC
jgi:hypothetical protein